MKNKLIKKIAIVSTIATMAIAGTSIATYASDCASILGWQEVDQYDVKVGDSYFIMFNQSIPFEMMHRWDPDANEAPAGRYVTVTDVYEFPTSPWSTERRINWIDNTSSLEGISVIGGILKDTSVYYVPEYVMAGEMTQSEDNDYTSALGFDFLRNTIF